MANELQAQNTSGKTVYAVVLNATGSVWNGTAFVTPASANWATYAIALAEVGGTGLYEGNFPAVAAGVYSVIAFQQVGGTPAVSDINLGASPFHWDGAAEVPLSAIAAKTGLIVAPDLAGTVSDTAPTSGSFKGNAALSATDSFYVNGYLAFTGGALQGLARKITGYTGATRLFTFGTAFPASPANGDPFVILGGTT